MLVDNDVNLMALGERSAHHPDCPALVLVKVATGIGAGVVMASEYAPTAVDRRLLRAGGLRADASNGLNLVRADSPDPAPEQAPPHLTARR